MTLPLVALSVVSDASAAPSAELPVAAQFAAGDTWVYDYRRDKGGDGLELVQTVVSVEGGVVNFQGRPPGLAWRYLQGNEAEVLSPWRVWPLTLGRRWTYRGRTLLPTRQQVDVEEEAEVAAFEVVDVPAGRFMAYRIEMRGRLEGPQGAVPVHHTHWYVPELRADVRSVIVWPDMQERFELKRVAWGPRL